VFGKCALEPAESFFFFAERDVNCRDQKALKRIASPFLQKLSENISRLRLPTHPGIGNGKPATREMGRLLGFGVERDRFREFPFSRYAAARIRIQIKVIWIELQRPLALTNCVVDLVIGEVGAVAT